MGVVLGVGGKVVWAFREFSSLTTRFRRLVYAAFIRAYGVCQGQILRRGFLRVYFSACVIGYQETSVKTANAKIQKEQEQSEAQPDGA